MGLLHVTWTGLDPFSVKQLQKLYYNDYDNNDLVVHIHFCSVRCVIYCRRKSECKVIARVNKLKQICIFNFYVYG